MTTHTLPLPLPRTGRRGADRAARAGRLVREALDRLAERRRMRRTAAELRGLSDATLKDIGVSRSEIDFVVLQRGSRRRPVR